MKDEWFGYIYQNGQRVASVSGKNEKAVRTETAHYATMYAQDGPVKVVVKRAPRTRNGASR